MLYAIGTGFWTLFTVVYLAQSIRRPSKMRTDIEHPISGPFIAFIPIVAVLLAQHYAQYAPTVGRWVVVSFAALLALIAARLVASWLSGGLSDIATVHGGYFLPAVAGPFIASIGLSTVGLHDLALYAFGAGLFFWLTLGTVVLYRYIAGGELPDSQAPALTAFLAASATAAIAWLVAHPGDGPLDTAQSLLTGVFFTMLLVQIALVSKYWRVRFGMQYWVFTFPVASSANYLIRLLERTDVAGSQVWAWAVLAVATGFIAAVGVGTVALVTSGLIRRVRVGAGR